MRSIIPLRSSSAPTESSTNQSSATQTTRRRLLAAGGGLAMVGLTGCMGALNSVAEAILKDVNVMNGTDAERSGSVTVDGPDGETLLSEEFTVSPQEDESSEGETSSTPTYEDVFTGSGEYTVSVSLDSDSAIDGTTDAETTVTVDNPDDQHIIVALGASESESPIEILVIDDFSDLAEQTNESVDSGDGA